MDYKDAKIGMKVTCSVPVIAEITEIEERLIGRMPIRLRIVEGPMQGAMFWVDPESIDPSSKE
jgi:hypothetical protein